MSFDLSVARDLPPELYPLSWLIGRWQGTGRVSYQGIEDSGIDQVISFSHSGGPYLAYSATTHLDEPAGGQLWHEETGFWRLTPGQTQADPPFELEVLLADPAGSLSLYLGQVNGQRIDLASDAIMRTASAAEYSAAARLYGLVESDLLWAWDVAALGQPLASYISARLARQD
ncbi:MAG: FABP family protein [Micrococcales bacterium]|nr:FABP family protein [Micrococcales bacterium]